MAMAFALDIRPTHTALIEEILANTIPAEYSNAVNALLLLILEVYYSSTLSPICFVISSAYITNYSAAIRLDSSCLSNFNSNRQITAPSQLP